MSQQRSQLVAGAESTHRSDRHRHRCIPYGRLLPSIASCYSADKIPFPLALAAASPAARLVSELQPASCGHCDNGCCGSAEGYLTKTLRIHIDQCGNVPTSVTSTVVEQSIGCLGVSTLCELREVPFVRVVEVRDRTHEGGDEPQRSSWEVSLELNGRTKVEHSAASADADAVITATCGPLQLAQWWLEREPAPLLALRLPRAYDPNLVPVFDATKVCSISFYGNSLTQYPSSPEMLRTLTEMRVVNCSASMDLTALSTFPNGTLLRRFCASGSGVSDISALSTCSALEEVDVSSCVSLRDLRSLEQLPLLRRLGAAWTGVQDVTSVAACTALIALDLSHCRGIHNFNLLSGLKRLRQLTLQNTAIRNIEWITACVALESVDFSLSLDLSDFSPLASLENLRAVVLSNSGVSQIEWVPRCPALTELTMDRCRQLQDLTPIVWTTGLTHLSVACSDVGRPGPGAAHIQARDNLRNDNNNRENEMQPVSENHSWLPKDVSQLIYLNVSQCSQLMDLSVLAGAGQLMRLNASGTAVRDVSWVHALQLKQQLQQQAEGSMHYLRVLDFSRCTRLTDYTPLASLVGLERLDLSWSYVGDISWLTGCLDSLVQLQLSQCTKLVDVCVLRGAVKLTHLDLSGSAVRDLSWIETCQALRELNLSRCSHLASLTPLGTLTTLESLNLSYTRASTINWMTSSMFSLKEVNISRCALLQDATPLKALPHLHTFLAASSGISDISWVAHCPLLAFVDVTQCPDMSGMAVLGGVRRWRRNVDGIVLASQQQATEAKGKGGQRKEEHVTTTADEEAKSARGGARTSLTTTTQDMTAGSVTDDATVSLRSFDTASSPFLAMGAMGGSASPHITSRSSSPVRASASPLCAPPLRDTEFQDATSAAGGAETSAQQDTQQQQQRDASVVSPSPLSSTTWSPTVLGNAKDKAPRRLLKKGKRRADCAMM